VAPELGKLAGILVGTENGSWGLEEVQVASSRTGVLHRWGIMVCVCVCTRINVLYYALSHLSTSTLVYQGEACF